VKLLFDRLMLRVNGNNGTVTGQSTLNNFIENHYLPWVRANKAAATANDYDRLWQRNLKPSLGEIALANLQTAQVTDVLTKHAQDGLGARSLSHAKWMLSGVYQYAIASGIVPANPVPNAKWLCKVARPAKQAEYALDEVIAMLRILEPLDLRAALAVALAYFAALRPAEIRGLMWSDYNGTELNVRRSVWRNHVGETKTADSADSVMVIEPLRGLLERLRSRSPQSTGYILQNSEGKPLSLDSLNYRFIAPTLKVAGIAWRGYYPGRRGISSLVTDTSKNALNSTGLLRHSTPITALKHYTRAQKDSIAAALKTVEKLATMRPPTESVQ
jgi:integrase